MKRLAILTALLAGCAFTYDPDELAFIECDAGLTACPADAPTYCADLRTDAANCGACGNVCESYQYCDPAGDCAMPRRVFITSTNYDQAGFTPATNADAACAARATAATLGGTWMAWWSTDVSDVRDRFSHRIGRFERLDGALIATGWSDLVDGTIENAISLTETLTSRAFTYVWTGTEPDGTFLYCGRPGNSGHTDGAWTADTGTGYNCSGGFTFPIYCFEQ